MALGVSGKSIIGAAQVPSGDSVPGATTLIFNAPGNFRIPSRVTRIQITGAGSAGQGGGSGSGGAGGAGGTGNAGAGRQYNNPSPGSAGGGGAGGTGNAGGASNGGGGGGGGGIGGPPIYTGTTQTISSR